MSGGKRWSLGAADRIAAELLAALEPAVDRIAIAGSIRRRVESVGDVEFIVIPRLLRPDDPNEPAPVDLFGDPLPIKPLNLVDVTFDGWIAEGLMRPRLDVNSTPHVGSGLKWLDIDVGAFLAYRGWRDPAGQLRGKVLALDVYAADVDTWGSTLTLRTGCNAFSKRLVTATTQGGFCPPHLQFKDGRIQHRRDGERLATPEEADVFDALGLETPTPEERTEFFRPRRRA